MPPETSSGLQQVIPKSFAAEQVVQVQQGRPTEDQYRSAAHMQQQEEVRVRRPPPPPKGEKGKVEEREGRGRRNPEGGDKERKEDKKGLASKGQVIDILI
ncbi:MAG: hypothetical protein DRP94_05455 [Candidatus Latescibacterota bacterium]|nr:MAG: hypothetical protein DRP94_05455 [Candidatus Latescibacterota bacterium]